MRVLWSLCTILLALASGATPAQAYTANKVWFEFRPNGRYRVVVNYTVPALKEFRESYVDFTEKRAAEKFYWSLIRGADFYPANAGKTRFNNNPAEPDPW